MTMLLAQITDPHIKANRSIAYGHVDTAAFLEAVVNHINAFRPKIDAVIVTGDITDMGDSAAYDAARPIFKRLTMPWYVIPGNHDDRTNLRAAFCDHAYLKPGGDFIHYAIDAHPLRLVGLDTTVAGQPYGFLCRERLDWLDTTLRLEPEKPTLVYMHHPPFDTGIRHMDVQKLRNPDGLLSVLTKHPQVRHIACGHVHRAVETTLKGIGASIGPNGAHCVTLDFDPTAPPTFTMEPPAIRIFQLSDAGEIVCHTSHIGAFGGSRPFYMPDGRLID